MQPLPPPPSALVTDSGLVPGLFAGSVGDSLGRRLPGRGRNRRWWYAAAATPDGSLSLGAAVVDLGPLGATFVWVQQDGAVRTFDRKVPFPGLGVGRSPAEGGHANGRGFEVRIDEQRLDIVLDDLGGGPFRVHLAWQHPCPVVCSTPTPGGGLNVTQKAAGHDVAGTVTLDDRATSLAGSGWYDWTSGRQDRHTTWRWAAGAGRSRDGRTVGINVSTGMNGAGPGEDVAWVDGRPVPLEVKRLEPVDPSRPAAQWVVAGPDWELAFDAVGARAARENLLVVRSAYVQPIGTFHGTLPGPDGELVHVDAMPGVTEDHEAVW